MAKRKPPKDKLTRAIERKERSIMRRKAAMRQIEADCQQRLSLIAVKIAVEQYMLDGLRSGKLAP
jgi:hypothetical protein